MPGAGYLFTQGVSRRLVSPKLHDEPMLTLTLTVSGSASRSFVRLVPGQLPLRHVDCCVQHLVPSRVSTGRRRFSFDRSDLERAAFAANRQQALLAYLSSRERLFPFDYSSDRH
jgi:hypothetical protein